MKARQYTEAQIIAVLHEGEAGAKVVDLCRKYGMSDATLLQLEGEIRRSHRQRIETAQISRRRKPTSQADCSRPSTRYPGAQGITLKKLPKPKVKRLAVSHVRESLGLSERRACQLVNVSSSVYRYRPKPSDDDVLRHRLRELAEQRKRFGSPRLHIMLKREGLVINHKRTERIYREEGLALRRKRRRKGAAGARGNYSITAVDE